MAMRKPGYFDGKGQFFKTPEEATVSDLASVLGRIGDVDGLTQGIAKILYERRVEIEQIYADHDAMVKDGRAVVDAEVQVGPVLVAEAHTNVSPLRHAG